MYGLIEKADRKSVVFQFFSGEFGVFFRQETQVIAHHDPWFPDLPAHPHRVSVDQPGQIGECKMPGDLFTPSVGPKFYLKHDFYLTSFLFSLVLLEKPLSFQYTEPAIMAGSLRFPQ
jgi:hypothetical protein